MLTAVNEAMPFETLSAAELLASTRELVRQTHVIEADLLVRLAAIDERRLYLDFAAPSMLTFCVREFGFSEDVACTRLTVARALRRLPGLLEPLRSGRVHLSGLRVLVPHLTPENHVEVLALAAGRSRREIEILAARIAPRAGLLPGAPAASVVALAGDTFRVHFTAGRPLLEKLHEAQDLMEHRISRADFAAIFEQALDALIEKVKKERFAVGRKRRKAAPIRPGADEAAAEPSRHVPADDSRAAFERDGGRCAFVDERGIRCPETGGLELDHIDGFARTGRHGADHIRLLCRAHNQRAADLMYGKEFMERARAKRNPLIQPGNDEPDG